MSSLEVGQRVECVFTANRENQFLGKRGFVIGLIIQKSRSRYGQSRVWYRVEFDTGERRRGLRLCWKPIEPRTDDSWVKTKWEDCPWQPIELRFKQLVNEFVYKENKSSV